MLAREGVTFEPAPGSTKSITEAGLPRIFAPPGRRPRPAPPRRPAPGPCPAGQGLPRRHPASSPAATRRRLAELLLVPAGACSPWTSTRPRRTPPGYPPPPATSPAISYLLSLLALKLTATRRVSHVHDVAAATPARRPVHRPGPALPKTTALTTYSYQVDHARQAAFPHPPLDKAAICALGPGRQTGRQSSTSTPSCTGALSQDPALEKHYMPSRSQRTRSGADLLRKDADSHALLYANADLAKANQGRGGDEPSPTTRRPSPATTRSLFVMDSKVTTQDQLWALTERGIGFITLLARTPKVTAALHALPAKAWSLDRPCARAGGKSRTIRAIDDPTAKLSRSSPATLRQLAVGRTAGHDEPTLLISNRDALPAKQVIETYARRMNIEQRPRRSHPLPSASTPSHSAVPLNVDLDIVLSVLAHTVCAALRRRLPGYATATPDTLQRRFLTTGGARLAARNNQIVVRLEPTHLLTPSCARPDLTPDPHHPLARQPHPTLRVRLTPSRREPATRAS